MYRFLFISSFLVPYAVFIAFIKKKSLTLYLKLLPFFLLVTVFVELGANLMIKIEKRNAHTFLIYNPFTCFEFVFYIFMIREFIKRDSAKKILLGLIVIYPIAATINILLFQGVHQFHSFTSSIGCLLMAACCIYYFYELFLMPHSVNLLRQPPFWICTGLLFYYAFTYPVYGLSNLMSGLSNHLLIIISRILDSLNILLYSFFSIAFLCRLRIRK